MRAHRTRKRQIEYDGKKFDNPGEVERYQLLMLRYRAGEITLPDVHPKYDIVINGIKVCSVVADFRYYEHHKVVVEDVKAGYNVKKKQTRRGSIVREWIEREPILTDIYKLKKKLMLAQYAIEILEIWK